VALWLRAQAAALGPLLLLTEAEVIAQIQELQAEIRVLKDHPETVELPTTKWTEFVLGDLRRRDPIAMPDPSADVFGEVAVIPLSDKEQRRARARERERTR
jgi:hypothetical protein